MKLVKSAVLILIAITCVMLIKLIYTNSFGTSMDLSGVEKITSENKREASLFEVVGDISIKCPHRSYGREMTTRYGEFEITKDSLFYLEDEKVDESGKLIGDNIYIDIENFVKNNTNRTIELDLNEFYLVLSDDYGNIARGSRMPRYTCLPKSSDEAVINDFKLILKPYAETSFLIVFVEKLSNVRVGGEALPSICNYRIKCNDDVGFYNLSTTYNK